MTKNILTVDTATPQVTAGIIRVSDHGTGLATIAVESHLDARAHNEVLTPLILSSLATAGLIPTNLDAVVVGCGPGPFTGLRVGMATASSFADALDIPCYGVSTLDAIAAEADSAEASAPAGSDYLVVTDARRREVYFAAYRDGTALFGPAVNKAVAVPAAVAAEVADFTPQQILGSKIHAEQVAQAWQLPSDIVRPHLPTPAGLATAAGFADGSVAPTPQPLVPLYLRRPDAVPPKQLPKSPAIPDVSAL